MKLGFRYMAMPDTLRSPVWHATNGSKLGYLVTEQNGRQWMVDLEGRRMYRILRWKHHNSTVSACGGSWVPQ